MVMSVNSQRSHDRILTQRNELHRVTSREKQRRHKLKGPRDKIASERNKVAKKATGHETNLHKTTKWMACTEDTKPTQPVDAHTRCHLQQKV